MGSSVTKGKCVIDKETRELELQTSNGKAENISNIEKSNSASVIEEKERRRFKEQNEPETQMAITEAEKMLKIYRTEMAAETKCNDPEIPETPFYHKPKQDIRRPKERNKTLDHNGRIKVNLQTATTEVESKEIKRNRIQDPSNRLKDENNEGENDDSSIQAKAEEFENEQMIETKIFQNEKFNAIYMFNDRTFVASFTNHDIKVKQTADVEKLNASAVDEKPADRQEKTNSNGLLRSLQQTSPTLAKEDGSLLTKKVSQHCPNLLGERRSSENFTTLKPLDKNSIRFEKQRVRSELEIQGILAPGTYEKAANQVIIGDLEEAGILQKGKKYTLSSGLPIRRPPPRVNQLPPLNKPQNAAAIEISFAEPGAPAVSVKDKDISFVDYGRPLVTKTDKEVQQGNNVLEPRDETGDIPNEEAERMSVANKLKMKLFALETL